MRHKTYTLGCKRLVSGVTTIGYCTVRSSLAALRDLGLGMFHHPILTIIIVSSFLYMFVTLQEARAERDHYNEQAYNIQQRNETLEILVRQQN